MVVQLTTANGLFGLGLPELALVGGAAVLLFGEQNWGNFSSLRAVTMCCQPSKAKIEL